MGRVIRFHTELDCYRRAFDAAMTFFEHSKRFPRDEVYSLTDQGRRSSRSVCANLAEAWRKRRYRAAFISKLNDAEAEAAETQTWVQFAVKCGYLDAGDGRTLYAEYDEVLAMLAAIICKPDPWLLPATPHD